MKAPRVVLLLLPLAVGVVWLGCDSLQGIKGIESPFVTFDPVLVSCSWSGGIKGEPNDCRRLGPPASKVVGRLCPPTSVLLRNFSHGPSFDDAPNFAGLHIRNNCTIPVSYSLCVAKGSLEQPRFGMQQCATDPFDTPLSRLTPVDLGPGLAHHINATLGLFVVVMWCSDQSQLTGPPLASRVHCFAAR
ncbi:MAG: hypothetical protein ACE5HQ_08870 [Gemmatimonadota bacterium]